jgi:hypothetical protein
MGIIDSIRNRLAQLREDHALRIIDDLNGEPRGTTASDVRDRRGKNGGVPSERHLDKSDLDYSMREARIADAEAQRDADLAQLDEGISYQADRYAEAVRTGDHATAKRIVSQYHDLAQEFADRVRERHGIHVVIPRQASAPEPDYMAEARRMARAHAAQQNAVSADPDDGPSAGVA